jgi:TolB-like protein
MHKIPSKQEIFDELEKILVSRYFIHSKILSAFLDFVVRKTVEDHAIEIKEYTIGLQIMTRKEGFNPQKDASVRIHAVRLRKFLEKYYKVEGRDDKVVIDIPKGSYFARFRYSNSPTTAFAEALNPHAEFTNQAPDGRPLIAVMPFVTYSDKELAQVITDGIGEKLCAELSRHEDISVLSYYSTVMYDAEKWDLQKLRDEFNVTHLVTGSINYFGKDMFVSYELVNTADFKILWAETIEEPHHSNIFLDFEKIAIRISSVLGGYTGMIQLRKNSVIEPAVNYEKNVIDAVFWFYHFQIRFTEDIYRKAVEQLEKCVKAYPSYALAHALLAHLYADGPLFGYDGVDDLIGRSRYHAEEALRLDPNCQQAYFTLALIQILTGDKQGAQLSMERCIAINPNSAFFLGGVGLGMSLLGYWERSLELIKKAAIVNPIHRWWLLLATMLHEIQQNDLVHALDIARQIDPQRGMYYRVYEIALHAYLGQDAEAAKIAEEYCKKYPNGINIVDHSMDLLLSDREVYDVLHQGFVRSGYFIHASEPVVRVTG